MGPHLYKFCKKGRVKKPTKVPFEIPLQFMCVCFLRERDLYRRSYYLFKSSFFPANYIPFKCGSFRRRYEKK
jgi:hypothetical protein